MSGCDLSGRFPAVPAGGAADVAPHPEKLPPGPHPVSGILRPAPGRPELAQVTYQDLRAFLAAALKKNRKTTVARKLSALRTFFKYLQRQGVASQNPAKLAPSPKLEKVLPHYLSVDEAFHLLGEPKGDDFGTCRDQAILEVFYGGGLRLSELAGLNLGDLDLAHRACSGSGAKAARSAWPFWASRPKRRWRPICPCGSGSWPQHGHRRTKPPCSSIPGAAAVHPGGGPGGGQVGPAGGAFPGPDAPRPAPQLRHPPVGGPGRPQGRPGIAGPCLHLHHRALHAPQPGLPDGGVRQGASEE